MKKYSLEFNEAEELEQVVDTNELLETILKNSNGIEWAKLLCKLGNIENFIEILCTSKSELLAIMKYRRLLHQQCKVKVSFIELNTTYVNNQFDKLHRLLEKMFLEPISDEQFEFILKKINNTENGIENLYNRHVEDKGLRILTVALII